jgi:hypothetical protein
MVVANGAPSGNGEAKPVTKDQLNRFEEICGNALMSRVEFFKKFFDPRRSIPDECGFPSGLQTPQWYQDLHDDGFGIAARVNEVLSRESWQVQPSVYEDEDAANDTPFEEAWDGLSKGLRGGEDGPEQSWYADESGSPVWEYLQRIDELSGRGQYGILLLGFDDVESDAGLSQPLKATTYKPGKDGKPAGGRRLLYMRCFPEYMAPVARFETDPTSPRYQKPVAYNVMFQDQRDYLVSTGQGLNLTSREVHWSRVVHVADNLGSSEVFGTERCRPVRNALLTLQKLYGGSGEMYWKGAFPGIQLKTQPSMGGDANVDRAAMRDTMENYMNGLQRYLLLLGMEAATLAPQVVDPTPQIAVQVELICIKLGIPIRVFKGSERGELASSQDDAAWNDRLRFRQKYYITPRIIVPLVDRLIAAGVLPEPEEGYFVAWPDLTSQSQGEKADVALKKTQAMSTFVSGGVEGLIPPLEYLTTILGMEDKEAQNIIDAAAKHMEEQQQEQLDLQQQQMEMQQQQSEAMGQLGGVPPAGGGPPGAPKPPAGPPGAPKPAPAAAAAAPTHPPPVPPRAPLPPVTHELAANFNPAQARGKAGTALGGRWIRMGKAGGRARTVVSILSPPTARVGTTPATSGTLGQAKALAGVRGEPKAPPPPGKFYAPPVHKDHNGDGVTDAARVGVPAFSIPPPPPVGRLPNLTPHERKVEGKFIEHYNKDPDGVADAFRDLSRLTTKKGDPVTFGTDEAKNLVPEWAHPGLSPSQRAHNRATLNLALHQTANAIAKRAFVRELDTLKPGDEIMVTVGGVGAGKGYALKKVPQALAVKARSKVVWDSAGDQNATENPWIQHEAERRGLKVNYVYVHADPKVSWAHPGAGVIKRAGDPKDGRMVDAQVFADSYAIGARNHAAFYKTHKDNPGASFTFLSNVIGKEPALLPGIPPEALNLNSRKLAKFALRTVVRSNAPARVKRGATLGVRVWGNK